MKSLKSSSGSTSALVSILSSFLVSLPICPAEAAPSENPPTTAPVYVVDRYDPKRLPQDDLKAALQRAQSENKRVLVQAGGDWCGWCKLLDKYFRENPRVAAALAADFLIIKVNYS